MAIPGPLRLTPTTTLELTVAKLGLAHPRKFLGFRNRGEETSATSKTWLAISGRVVTGYSHPVILGIRARYRVRCHKSSREPCPWQARSFCLSTLDPMLTFWFKEFTTRPGSGTTLLLPAPRLEETGLRWKKFSKVYQI
jgi:hypothetical protein